MKQARVFVLNWRIVWLLCSISGFSYGQSSSQKIPTGAPKQNDFDGFWSGTTSQGNNIYFVVKDNAIFFAKVGYTVPGHPCSSDSILTGYAVGDYYVNEKERPKIAKLGKFLVEVYRGGPNSVLFTINGKFASKSSMSGSVEFSALGAFNPPDLPCQTKANATWKAKKEALIPIDGEWIGTTSQGKEISFTVSDHGFVSMSVDFSFDFGSCRISGPTFFSQKAPRIIVDNTFSEQVSSRVSVTGMFSSDTSASGTISGKVNRMECRGSDEATWTAKKKK